MLYSTFNRFIIYIIIFIVLLVYFYSLYRVFQRNHNFNNTYKNNTNINNFDFNMSDYYFLIIWSKLNHKRKEILQHLFDSNIQICDIVSLKIHNKQQYRNFYKIFYHKEYQHLNVNLMQQKGTGDFTVIFFKDNNGYYNPKCECTYSDKSKNVKSEIRKMFKNEGKWLVHSSVNQKETKKNFKTLVYFFPELHKRWQELPGPICLEKHDIPEYEI